MNGASGHYVVVYSSPLEAWLWETSAGRWVVFAMAVLILLFFLGGGGAAPDAADPTRLQPSSRRNWPRCQPMGQEQKSQGQVILALHRRIHSVASASPVRGTGLAMLFEAIRQEWNVSEGFGIVRCGGLGTARPGNARSGRAGMDRRVTARKRVARRAWQGTSSLGKAGQARLGRSP